MAGTKTPNPVRIKPRLVSLATKSPADGAWRWEIKIDGFRFLARIDGSVVQVFTNHGHDWTNKVPRLARSLARLAVHSSCLDGEICFSKRMVGQFSTRLDRLRFRPDALLVLAVCCPHQCQLLADSVEKVALPKLPQ